MPSQPCTSPWGAVDATENPDAFVRTMDFYRGGSGDDPAFYPFFSFLGAREGSRILDLGCGSGGAVRALAPWVGSAGRVVGVDNSRAMIAAAQARSSGRELPVDFVLGDAHSLPFADATFDGVFSQGTFEFVRDPERALTEMIRVTRAGGQIVVNAGDFGSWVLDSANAELTERILAFARDHHTNGRIGRQLRRIFVECGLHDVRLIAQGDVYTEFDYFWQIWLEPWATDALKQGIISAAEADAWFADLRTRADARLFLLSGMDFTVIGTKG